MRQTEERDPQQFEVGAAEGGRSTGFALARLDRLREIARIVEGRHCTTLKYLASRYEMPEQLVTRDIAELRRIGVHFAGGPSVGYTMKACDDKGWRFLLG